MRVWMPLAALLLTALAGCLGGDAPVVDDETPEMADFGPGFVYEAVDANGLPVPVLLCHPAQEVTSWQDEIGGGAYWTVYANGTGDMCNFEMTPDQDRQGNEVTIAVNPTDPQNIVGGAKDYYPADAGECVWDGIYVTHDGGRTPFLDRNFDGSPWRLRAGDIDNFQENYASQFWCTTDPVAYFDVNGNLYYLLMAYQADPITGSKTGEDEIPSFGLGGGALNDWAFNRAVQIVAISDDGGDTFHTFSPVLEGSYPAAFHDKGWVAASADGTIHVMWAMFTGLVVVENTYYRSTDGGQTYTPIEGEFLSLEGSGGQGSFLEVGTGPEVYAMWTTGSGVQLRRSLDTGATWEAQKTVREVNGATMPGLDGRDRRGGFPTLATDRNVDSPFADALYIVWQDTCQDVVWSSSCSSEGSGIWFTSSFDKGDSWTEPVRISDDNTTTDWRIFPVVSVSPGGVIDVSWMSTRGARDIECSERAPSCEANYGDHYTGLEQYYTYSLDGGKTWSANVNIRDAGDGGWDASLCHHQNGNVFIGDYNDIDSSWQAAHPVWPDSRDGPCDVYTATVQRPMFAEGWGEEERAKAEDLIRGQPL